MIIQHLVSLTVQPSQSESGLLCSSAGVEAVPEVSPAGVEVRQLDADKEILAVSVRMTSSLFFFLFPIL